ncbi:MAG TPA: hypothetical protein VF145_01855 [Chitinophagaceae bacterium]
MKALIVLAVVCSLLACSSSRIPRTANEQIPDIAGTWYQDGNMEKPCYIVQNGRDLVFLSGTESSNGHFKSSMEVFASGWNRNGILANDLRTIQWSDRRWVKGNFLFPDVSGIWYEAGDVNKRIVITQDKTRLVMDNGSRKLNAYFYATNAVYCLENNNYAVYSPDKKTLTWGNTVWTRDTKN